MTALAGGLVLAGTVMIFAASELLDDAFLLGVFISRFRRRAPFWMRDGLIVLSTGAGLIVLGINLLHWTN